MLEPRFKGDHDLTTSLRGANQPNTARYLFFPYFFVQRKRKKNKICPTTKYRRNRTTPTMSAQSNAIQAALEAHVLQATQVVEDQLDEQIKR